MEKNKHRKLETKIMIPYYFQPDTTVHNYRVVLTLLLHGANVSTFSSLGIPLETKAASTFMMSGINKIILTRNEDDDNDDLFVGKTTTTILSEKKMNTDNNMKQDKNELTYTRTHVHRKLLSTTIYVPTYSTYIRYHTLAP